MASRQANNAVASERSIFSKNDDYNRVYYNLDFVENASFRYV